MTSASPTRPRNAHRSTTRSCAKKAGPFAVAAAVLVGVAFPGTARAEDTSPAASHAYNDFLFPGDGKISLTASTGLPYAALGELSVGIGDRFAVGGLAAGGPFLGGFATGVYPRVDMVHAGPVRFVLEAPLVWYPDLQNTDNWLVARPDVRAEAKTGPVRVHASLGVMYAKMVGASPVQGPIAAYGGGGLPSGVQQGSLWNTTGAGVAVALSPRTSVFAEGFLIMHGVELAGPEWFALPCGTFLGVSTTL